MTFDESIFIRSLIERPADALSFAQSFDPTWLRTVEYQPLLTKLFEFTNEHAGPPSLVTLREFMKDSDPKGFEARDKLILDYLDTVPYDPSQAAYNVAKAKNVAVAWSLESMFHSAAVQHLIDEADGAELMRQIQTWITKFAGSTEDEERRVEEAFEDLIKSRNWKAYNKQISCGIDIIDQWTGGGLTRRQLGIILAPTGQGKTTCLTIMAHKMALVEGKRVLFITNELSMNEIAVKLGTLVSGESLGLVATNPEIIRKSLTYIKAYNYSNKLYLVAVNRDISTVDIESIVSKYINLYGWAPEVVVIDYMERMKPTSKELKQIETWTWYGSIASDLIRMSKRLDVLVWTAAQTNRQGYNSKTEQGISQAQGSIRHLQEAAAVIAMRQRPEYPLTDENARVLEFTPLKMRHSRLPAEPVLLEANLDKMLITKTRRSPKDWTKNEDGTGFVFSVKYTEDEDIP